MHKGRRKNQEGPSQPRGPSKQLPEASPVSEAIPPQRAPGRPSQEANLTHPQASPTVTEGRAGAFRAAAPPHSVYRSVSEHKKLRKF